MAAEMVSSVIAQETVSQILSGLIQRYSETNDGKTNFERLEMAHMRLEAALQISDKWHITDACLFRWHKKLKRVVQECDGMMHRFKQRIQEDQRMEQEMMNSSLPSRIAYATKSFIFSAFGQKNEPSISMVKRFEWFADGASEFLRYVEVGGTPRCHMPFKSLIRNLMAGMGLQHKIVWRHEYPSYLLCVVPSVTPHHGIAATLKFVHKDDKSPEKSFFLGAMLQISESTDIVGTIVNCLQLFPPCFQLTIETIKKELTQLPSQDLSWVPYVDIWHRKHWEKHISFCTQWFRPDPLCCKKQQAGQNNKPRCCSNPDMVGIRDVSLDSVILVHLQCHVPVFENNHKQKTTTSPSQNQSSSQDYSPYMKAELIFTPHGSTKHRLPEEKTSAVVTIYGEEKHYVHTDITLDQLNNEIMLPNATYYFYRNPEAIAHQMLWMSKHGTEYIEFGKPRMEEMSVPCAARRVISRAASRKRKLQVQQDQVQVLGTWNREVASCLNSWVARAPVRLRGLIMDWIQRGKESQLAAVAHPRRPKI